MVIVAVAAVAVFFVETGEDGEVFAVFLEWFEGRSYLVVAA